MGHGQLVLGIDAGGSTTHARLRDGDGLAVDVTAEGLNLSYASDTDVERVLTAVHDRLGDVAPIAVHAGVAGCASTPAVARLERALTATFPGSAVRGGGDVQLILPAAGYDCGVAVVAGTGSIAQARTPTGTTRGGGWGAPLGDDGGGYWLVREALRAVLLADEHGADTGPLGEALGAAFGVETTRELVGAANRAFAQADWARHAPAVVGAAQAGDHLARAVLAAGAEALASMARRAASAAGIGGPVVLAGSLMTRVPSYAAAVMGLLAGMAPTVLEVAPVEGALRLAEQLASSRLTV